MKGEIKSVIIDDYNKYIRKYLLWWIVPHTLIVLAYFVLNDLGYVLLLAALAWIALHVFITFRKFKKAKW